MLVSEGGRGVGGDLCADWISISEVAGRPITDYNDLLAVMREIRESNETK